MPQIKIIKKKKPKPVLPPGTAEKRQEWAAKEKARVQGTGSGADRARVAGRGGALAGIAKRTKVARRAAAKKNDAHVQDYYRWKNRQR
jgi:hypothetical protein